MTSFTQNILAFGEEFTGHIPVWSVNGDEVGYMTDYAANSFYLRKGFAGKQGAKLVTKDWLFRDVPITVTSPNTQPASENGKVVITFTRDNNAIVLPPLQNMHPMLVVGGIALVAYLILSRGRR